MFDVWNTDIISQYIIINICIIIMNISDQEVGDLTGSKLVNNTTEQGENAQTPFQIQLPFYSFPSTHNVEEQVPPGQQVQHTPPQDSSGCQTGVNYPPLLGSNGSSAQIVNLGNTSSATGTGTPIYYFYKTSSLF